MGHAVGARSRPVILPFCGITLSAVLAFSTAIPGCYHSSPATLELLVAEEAAGNVPEHFEISKPAQSREGNRAGTAPEAWSAVVLSRSNPQPITSFPVAPEKSQAAADTRSIDLGKVVEGTELRHTFTIQNTTEQPFKVLAIKKSCACETQNIVEGTTVLPGANLEVVYLLSKPGAGERKGQLLITTDAEEPSLRTIELHLRAEIQPKLWATPSELQLSDEDSSKSEQLLRVESIIPGLLDTFQNATTNRGNIDVQLKEKLADALIFRVVIAPDALFGTSYDLIYFTFNNREHPSLNVRVRARKGHPLAMIPANLSLRAFASGETQARRVRILSPAGASGPFRITRVECPEGIVVGDIPAEAKHTCDVNLTFDQPKPALREQAVVFHTDPPGAVTLTVRYSAKMKP
jgi:hypothetical protein